MNDLPCRRDGGSSSREMQRAAANAWTEASSRAGDA